MHVSCTSQISKCSRVKTLSDRCIKRGKMHWGPVESQRNWARKRLWYVTVWSRCFISASHSHLWAADCVHRVILDAHFWTYGIKYLGMCRSKREREKKKTTPYDVSSENLHRWSARVQSQSEGVRTVNIKYTYGRFMHSPPYFIKIECQSFWNKDRREYWTLFYLGTEFSNVSSFCTEHSPTTHLIFVQQ